MRAAEHAAAAGDAAGAAALERRATGLLGTEDPRRAELSFVAAAHLADAGLRKDAEAAITEALATGGERRRGRLAAPPAPRVAPATVDADEIDAARATADEAYERCTELGDEWGIARALALRAIVHRARGHARAVLDDLTEAGGAVGRGRAGRASATRRSAARRPPCSTVPSRCGRRSNDARPSRPSGALGGGRTTEQDLRGALAVLLARAGRSDEARPIVATAVATLDELDAQEDLAVTLHRAGIVAWLGGDPAAAAEAFERADHAAALAREGRLIARIAASRANLLCSIAPVETDRALALTELAANRRAGGRHGDTPARSDGGPAALGCSPVSNATVTRTGWDARRSRSRNRPIRSTCARTRSCTSPRSSTAAERPNEAGSFRARARRLLSRKGAIATAAVAVELEVAPGDPA